MRIVYHPEVEKSIRVLPQKDESRIMKVIDLFVDYGFHLPNTYLKKVTKQIWELRAGRYRLFFGMIEDDAIIVFFFMKKTQKAPSTYIQLAQHRLKEYAK